MDELGRIVWDEVFMWIAKLLSMRSVCLHYKVGVVFAKGNKFVSGGYNGPPKGEPHCSKVGCAKCGPNGQKLPAGSGLCRGAHAELNAIVNSASLGGVSLSGTTIFCTYSPCYSCAKHLVGLGITEFVYEIDYDSKEESSRVQELFMRRNIALRKLEMSNKVLENIMSKYSTEELMEIIGRPELSLKFVKQP